MGTSFNPMIFTMLVALLELVFLSIMIRKNENRN